MEDDFSIGLATMEIDAVEQDISQYWTTSQAANFLGRSERSVRRLLQSGVLKGEKISGPFGLVWRVCPVSERLSSPAFSAEQKVAVRCTVDDDTRLFEANALIQELNEQIDNLEVQLSVVVDRNKPGTRSIECQSSMLVTVDTAEFSQESSWWQFFKIPNFFSFDFRSLNLKPKTSVIETA